MFGYSNSVYYQIALKLSQEIVSGKLEPGAQLPTVRDLAKQEKVNPNTIQKAYGLLEEEEIIFVIPRSGKFVTKNEKIIAQLRREILKELIRDFVKKTSDFNYEAEEVLSLIKEEYETDN